MVSYLRRLLGRYSATTNREDSLLYVTDRLCDVPKLLARVRSEDECAWWDVQSLEDFHAMQRPRPLVGRGFTRRDTW